MANKEKSAAKQSDKKPASKPKAGDVNSAGPVAPPPASTAADAEPMPVGYDPLDVQDFVLGNITLGELEGIGKDVQYGLAEQGYKMINSGKLGDAEKVFKGLIALDPFDSYFHTALGSILQKQDVKDEAIVEYSRALQINPFNATALANRGEIHFQKGELLEAMRDIQAALHNDPEGEEPATVRCRVLAMTLSKTIVANKAEIEKSLAQAKTKAKSARPAAAKPVAKKPVAKPAKKK